MNVSSFSRGSLFSFIVALHLAILWGIATFRQPHMEMPKPLPVVMVEMLPVQAPTSPKQQAAPEPKPVRKPEPKPKQESKPKPVVHEKAPIVPTPNTTPSERAISTPPSPPAAEAAPPAPPAPPAPAAPASVSAPRFDAAYLSNPQPPYPRNAQRMGEQGRVVLRVHVTPDGMPDEVRLQTSSGSSALDQSALETVRKKWKFVPAKQAGAAVAAWVNVPIDFKLD